MTNKYNYSLHLQLHTSLETAKPWTLLIWQVCPRSSLRGANFNWWPWSSFKSEAKWFTGAGGNKFNPHSFHFTENPFILTNVQGFACQKVCGAQETAIAVLTGGPPKFPKEHPSQIRGDPRPAGSIDEMGFAIELRYCHYRKMDDGW